MSTRTYIVGEGVCHLPVNLRTEAPTGVSWCGVHGNRERQDDRVAVAIGICATCRATAPPWWVALREGAGTTQDEVLALTVSCWLCGAEPGAACVANDGQLRAVAHVERARSARARERASEYRVAAVAGGDVHVALRGNPLTLCGRPNKSSGDRSELVGITCQACRRRAGLPRGP